jgi:very-short-patch-repair endonuclease
MNALRACGWTVLRFAARDLREPARLIATVKAALTGVSG